LADALRDKTSAATSATARYFDRRYVGDLIEQHVHGRADQSRALFALLALESWYERFVAPAPRSIGTTPTCAS